MLCKMAVATTMMMVMMMNAIGLVVKPSHTHSTNMQHAKMSHEINICEQ